MELQHFSHPFHPDHPLKLKEDQQNEHGSGQLVICNGCRDPILGPSYSCNDSEYYCNYNLHKSCAELPPEIHHPRLHKHPLVLLPPESGQRCDVCKQNTIFTYNCEMCDFDLDPKCASNLYDIIENESHQHNFTILRQIHKFECYVCGEYREGSNLYLCSICQLLVHDQCAWLSHRYIKIHSHDHCLKLTWFLEDIFPENRDCNICEQKAHESRRAVYYCHECESFVADTACTKDKFFDRKNPGATIALTDDESEKMNQIEEELELAAQIIKHFSHQHSLALNISDHDHELFKDITCNGCMRPITVKDGFYSCKEQGEEQPKSSCHFFLHKTCAQLPMQRHFQVHRHQLTLLPKAPSIDSVFLCSICNKLSQGFAYSCGESGCERWTIDLYCSILLEYYKDLRHESHIIHTLQLNRPDWDRTLDCMGCSNRINKFCFSCWRCNFHLCMTCVKLPLTAKHRYDLHPLKLTYGSDENELGEYYCEICEGKRDKKHWFYYCTNCDFYCHPHCILGRYPQVKLGGTYKHDAHPHPVTLVYKMKSVIASDQRVSILSCEKCDHLCQGLVYECSECNINIHRKCYGVRKMI